MGNHRSRGADGTPPPRCSIGSVSVWPSSGGSGSLPLGQQQIVEIARAVVHDTRVLMMDEPTSALTASEIPVLFSLIRDLASHGVGIVYISHRLEELLAVADDVTVLRDGAGGRPRAADRRQRRVDRSADDRA